MATAPPARTDLADTYPNPSNAQFRTGIGKLWDTLFGTGGLLGTTGNASDARAALGVGNISNRNLLINGNGAMNQRAYVSGVATTVANQYTLDRWRVVVSGQSLTFGAAAPGRTFTAPAGGVEQVIEAAAIEGGVYTLSWTGTATATVNGAAITNGGNTASLTPNANATVRFIGGTVTNPQFEKGTVATPFERIDPALELVKCRRFYYRNSTATQALLATGLAFSTTSAAFTIPLPGMRAAPTFTSAFLFPTNGSGSVITPSSSSFSSGTDSALVQINVSSGLTVGQASLLYAGNGSGGYIAFDAEIP